MQMHENKIIDKSKSECKKRKNSRTSVYFVNQKNSKVIV